MQVTTYIGFIDSSIKTVLFTEYYLSAFSLLVAERTVIMKHTVECYN